MDASQAAVNTAVVLIVLANLIWYRAKSFLRDNGRETHMVRSHLRDFAALRELAERSSDVHVARSAERHLHVLQLTLVGILLVAFPLFFWGASR